MHETCNCQFDDKAQIANYLQSGYLAGHIDGL